MCASLTRSPHSAQDDKHLEDKLRSQLKNAPIVRGRGPQIGIRSRATRISSRVTRTAVTGQRAVGTAERAVLSRRSAVPAQPRVLNVVEHVESLGSEFESHVLGDGEMLEQRHIEVGASAG